MTEVLTPKQQKKLLRPVWAAKRHRARKHFKQDGAMQQRLMQLPEFRNASLILCYVSVGDEADTRKILEHCFQTGKRVAVPHCYEESRMEFFEIRSFDELTERSAFGVPEPPDKGDRVQPDETALCVVPALAYDKNGFRLGYGKGFYDRYLKRFFGLTAGLCYDSCLCEHLPTNQNDCPVSVIVTEQQTIRIP